MVSLAEPRRRQKWTLNPRGTLWSNDESKFGQKLMEKYGWEKGTGLGANQDGMVDHITLKHKDNKKGVGCTGHDDTWLTHQDDFQNVLAALNVEHGEVGKKMDESEKKATLSEISKKSKRRVHYQKFVKGKDSSNYSADDLGCILGTKSDKLKNKSEPSTPKEVSENDDSTEEDDQKFVQRGNCTDYFAKKMAVLKAKGKFTDVPAWTEAKANPRNLGLGADKVEVKKVDEKVVERLESEGDAEEDSEHSEGKKKKKSKKNKKEQVEEQVDEEVCEESKKSKKKKSKKDRVEKLEFEDDVVEKPEPVEGDVEEVEPKKKKSKKNKKKKEDVSEILEEISIPEEESTKKKKTKKSKKEKVSEEEEIIEDDSGCENDEAKNKKAKKGKKEKVKEKKLTYSDEEKENVKKNKRKAEGQDEESADISVSKKKKSKKNNDTSEKIPGFQGSNILTIPGYGMEAK